MTMTLWTAYFLGVGTTFLVLIAVWLLLRIAEPWAMALASGAPVGFAHILGMRIRKTDPRVVVAALVILTKSGEPISPFRLEAIYLTLPDSERDVDNLVRAARQTVASAAALE